MGQKKSHFLSQPSFLGEGRMRKIKIRDEYIKLDQLLKWAGVSETGGQAKELIKGGLVEVNGIVESKRGRKLRPGDVVKVQGDEFEIE